jgi:alkylhydroperoxidase/carboxymuconolactone decarboxylase family protein YurZ
MSAVAPEYQEALRRLALNDERYVASVLARHAVNDAQDHADPRQQAFDDRTKRLVDLAALIAMGSGPTGIDAAVTSAFGAGATPEDIVEVLLSIAPVVGSARIVSCAPHIAAAIGYDMETDLEELREPA